MFASKLGNTFQIFSGAKNGPPSKQREGSTHLTAASCGNFAVRSSGAPSTVRGSSFSLPHTWDCEKHPWPNWLQDALALSYANPCTGRLLTSEFSSRSKASKIQHWLQGYQAVIQEEFYLAQGAALAKMFSQASLGKWTALSNAQPCEGFLCLQLHWRLHCGWGLHMLSSQGHAEQPCIH